MSKYRLTYRNENGRSCDPRMDMTAGTWYLKKDGDKVLEITTTPNRREEDIGSLSDMTHFDEKGAEPISHMPDSKRKALMFDLFETACEKALTDSSYNGVYNAFLIALTRYWISPDLHGAYNETVLHIAAKYGRVEVMDILLKKGADARAKTSVKGRTAEDYLKAFKKQQAKKNGMSMRQRLEARKDAEAKAKAERSLRAAAGLDPRG